MIAIVSRLGNKNIFNNIRKEKKKERKKGWWGWRITLLSAIIIIIISSFTFLDLKSKAISIGLIPILRSPTLDKWFVWSLLRWISSLKE